MNKKLSGRSIARILATLMTVSLAQGGAVSVNAEEPENELNDPRVTWNYRETVTFGNYWQEDTNGDEVADKNDEKQPITWQILEKYDDGTALVLADKVLDWRHYHYDYESNYTWAVSDLRRWLNGTYSGDFYNEAFNEGERDVIKPVNLENNDNPVYGAEGGSDTTDKVFFLSIDDIINTSYGFNEEWSYGDQARLALPTSYIKDKCRNYSTVQGYIKWWLRSAGDFSCAAAISECGYGQHRNGVTSECGVRPALRIDLSSSYVNRGDAVKTSIKNVEYDTVVLGKYKGQDIRWRVLDINGDDAFLLADNAVDVKQYNEEVENGEVITWKDSDIRAWLNGYFYNIAFNNDEKEVIKSTYVVNDDHPWYGTDCGPNTTDKLFLMSYDEVTNLDYGFSDLYSINSEQRSIGNTASWDYCWWLRSLGANNFIGYVEYQGFVNYVGYNMYDEIGIRPAMHIDLSSDAWKKINGGTEEDNSENPFDNILYDLAPEFDKYSFSYDDAYYDDGNSVLMMVRVYPELSEEYTYTFSDRTANMAWSAFEERKTPDGCGTEIVFRGNTQFSDSTETSADFHMEIVKKNSDDNTNYGKVKFPITFTGIVKSEGEQQNTSSNNSDSTTEAPNQTTKNDKIPSDNKDSKETKDNKDSKDSKNSKSTKASFKNAGKGIGKISSDGKILKDTNDKTWYMTSKLKKNDLKKNLYVAVKNSGKYKITKVTKKKGKIVSGTVTYMAPYDLNCTKAVTANNIEIDGVKFKVTSINANALKSCKKIKSFVVGENISSIGKSAFKDCKNLKNVTIKTKTLKSIGSNAFKGTNAKIKIKVPKKKLDKYEKMIRKADAPKGAKITK